MKNFGGRQGFTLLEMMIVVGIIGIVLAFAIPTFTGMSAHLNLKNAAAQVSGEMAKARMRAIYNRKGYVAVFNLNNATMKVKTGLNNMSTIATIGADWKGVEIYKDTSDPDVPSLAVDSITFRSDGSAYAVVGTDVTLLGKQAVYLRNKPYEAGGERFRVSVLGSTGKVAMEQWKGSQWETGF